MNWKNEAIERLRTYPSVVMAIKNLSSEIRRLEAVIQAPGSVRLDGPVHGAQTHEDWLLDNLMSLQMLKARLESTQQWKAATDRAMALLPEQEQSLIRQLYLDDRQSVELVSQNHYASRSTMYRHRDKALETFTKALYGPVC